MEWFAARGVALKTEADGRVFPVTDDSATIVDCLQGAARKAGVVVRTGTPIRTVQRSQRGFTVTLGDGSASACDRVLLATGGSRPSAGAAIAERLGHRVEPPVSSLFTFHVDDARIRGLEGLSAPAVLIRVAGTSLAATGPLLVTHHGMSGPAVLKLSSWAARELAGKDYRFTVTVNWAGGRAVDDVAGLLAGARESNPRRQIRTWNPVGLPGRLWERLTEAARIHPATVWTSVSNAALKALSVELTAGEFAVAGKTMNKEEFVTCGGVKLAEVDFRTMESRICPGLHFAGEVLDIDGLTGGFNFQAAWTTGWLAGRAMAQADATI